MQTALVILIAIVLLGGGWYFYTQQSGPATNTNVTDPFGTPTGNQNTNTPTTNTNTGTDTATNTNTGTSTQTAGSVKEFTVTGQNFSFAPSTMTVKRGDRVRITFRNSSGTHDLRVDGYNVGTKVIQGGASETFEFVADETGSFEYYCSVGQHRQMGMVGTLTVTP